MAGSLKESLSKFKKQQEKCQTTLTNIAAKTVSSRPTSHKAAPSSSSPLTATKTPAPAVKFSNDTERLQHINSIRKGPVGAQIKRVIDLLLEVHIHLYPHLIPFLFLEVYDFPQEK